MGAEKIMIIQTKQTYIHLHIPIHKNQNNLKMESNIYYCSTCDLHVRCVCNKLRVIQSCSKVALLLIKNRLIHKERMNEAKYQCFTLSSLALIPTQ